MYRAGFYDHTVPGLTIKAIANASGIAQGFLGPVPQGYCWYVERMTSWSNTSQAAPILEVFVQTTDQAQPSSATVGERAGRQDVTLAAKNDIADESSPIFVPEGYHLVAFWTGLNSGDQAQLSTQICVHRTSLDIESRELELQQTEPTPDINAEEVKHEDSLVAEAVHATADLFRDVGKVL